MVTTKFVLRAAALGLAFAAWHPAIANPTGPSVASGTASFAASGPALTVTNSPGAIINWQRFSIGPGELTRFNQQSAASAVLNRVTTHHPSAILGSLQSNGRVFLINPSGIVFGAGARIDVAGLVASTLNLSDADFLSGRMRFAAARGAGSVVNNGAITTVGAGAPVYLIGQAVTNGGVITSPQGEVLLAAGKSVELADAGTPDLRVQITAPKNQALNVGSIIADSGRVNIYAGLISQKGLVQANTAVVGQDGRIVLKATRDVTLHHGSSTTAVGPEGSGGLLELEGRDILVSGHASSGDQIVRASRDLTIRGVHGDLATLSIASPSFSEFGVQRTQDISAGRSLTLDARHGDASLSADGGLFNEQIVRASGIELRGGACGPGCTYEAAMLAGIEAFQTVTVENGGRLLLRDGAIMASSSGAIDFTSGGQLVLRGGSAPGSGVRIVVSDVRSIAGSPDVTLSAGGSSAELSAGIALRLHARNLTVTGGRDAANEAAVFGGFLNEVIVDRHLTLRARGGPASLGSFSDTSVTVGKNLTLQGGYGDQAYAQIRGDDLLTLNVGGVLRMKQGGGEGAWARMQVETGTIGLRFPNRSSGGWFVNGIAGAVTNRDSGFFAAGNPAVPGSTLIVDYGP